MEVRRSTTDIPGFTEHLKERAQLVPDQRILGVVVSHSSRLFDRECKPDWLKLGGEAPPIIRLLDKNNKPDTNEIMAFIYFLAQIAGYESLGTK